MQTAIVLVEFERDVEECFGRAEDPIELVVERTQRRFTDPRAIVWEGDAQTFQFSFVSRTAEQLLGYPTKRWTQEPSFWADVVIAPDDRDDAIAYCALATTKRADHVFEYRARRVDGSVLWLRDYVRVAVGPRGIASVLRGIMVDVSAEKRATETFHERATYRLPSPEALEGLA